MKYKRKIWVFGSNREGRHGAGAALAAVIEHGAVYWQARGLQGDSYAIITKELRKGKPPVTCAEICKGVHRFLVFAKNHLDWEFNVTAVGCGLAGFRPGVIAPMFYSATLNVKLPEEFVEVLTRLKGA